ncbi:hypothetical protein JOD63_002938 [Microbacterium terrae]|uniref:Beta-galactosidase n=2 Tax=Microbacterium terrae TaxID=69369 RepID=A0A0M2GWU6_9MICO|nr:glycoside hydrolase family 2 TIM barrel-domain containing protein [Microbacterium terrae]KJL38388.1 Beta-galactosidase [Microbacterium terrae]MBP1078970.1 hypothetical protein [Microbacterium terrae]GLJ98370.1 beta-galactosidase [Microbacterium terrae]
MSARTLFTDGWTFRRTDNDTSASVRLPHDAMILETRTADAETGNHGGYFPGGSYVYARSWTAPADATQRTYSLFFEGVYGDTRVLVNGREVARCNSGYREFTAPLTGVAPGETALIDVLVDNTRVPNSRWYSGSGIYRPVWLESAGPVRIAPDGVHVVTRSISGDATVDVTIRVEGELPSGATASAEFSYDGERVVREHAATATGGVFSIPVTIPTPRLWSADSPHLYEVRASIAVDGDPVDQEQLRTGLRTVTVDARRGLRINGATELLRGACVHHDSGILGAATFAASESRRARILKAAGYNAIRSSHNPLSRAFLDACDEIGLYVMDELTDVWLKHKTHHDTADQFADVWPADAAAMIQKDRNRPSVIMYSIGNEIAETATQDGIDAAHAIHRYFAQNDPTRPTTLAVNLLLNLMSSRGSSPFEREQYLGEKKEAKDKKEATSTAANMLTAKLGRVMELAARLPAADKASRGAFGTVDVAGYNYAYGRYAADRKRYPNRVIVGSESMPGDLPAIWKRVTTVPGVIGDFMWTGWDYLGESGIGTWSYGSEPGSINKPYPALTAGPGAFDITGLPGAPALLAQAVWGTATTPGIAVRPLGTSGQRANRTPWRTSDAVPSWSWRALAGQAQIEVYSADDEVEVLLNDRSLGRKKAGERVGFVTRFRTQYEPGELVAIGYRDGAETGRSTLRSAGTPTLRLRPETTALQGPDDLAHVWIELADENGTVDMSTNDTVTVTVDGAGTLAALGTGAAATTESFTDDQHSTHRGRALAIVRGSDQRGFVTITATSARHGSATIILSPADTEHEGVPA